MAMKDIKVFKTKWQKKDGSGEYSVAYIDRSFSSELYPYSSILKKNKANFNQDYKVWFWFIGETEDKQRNAYNAFIKPTIKTLTQQEPDENGIISVIDKAIDIVSKNPVKTSEEDRNVSFDDPSKITAKLESFKKELVNAMSEESFKSKIEPIIRFRKAMGRGYSLLNTILIMIQDPNARMVKSRTNWLGVNRTVKANARAILMWTPDSIKYPVEKQKEIKRNFLNKLNKKDESELTVAERETLNILYYHSSGSFTLRPNFFDISQTEQISGKEEIVSDKQDNLDWYEEGREDEAVKIIYDSLIDFAQKNNIKVDTTSDIGGARGVSRSGSIEILSNSGKDVGLTKTLAHELSHELLHQAYLSKTNETMKSYFIGTSEGRGVVEQQAEVSAWIVMKNFGFDMPLSLNYIAIWGADEKNVTRVFDQVAKVATLLISHVESNMKSLKTESEGDEASSITGFEIAKMLGVDDLYRKYENIDKIQESFYSVLQKIKK